MNVTLRQLQAFIAVADLGRFNLAASELNLTQSAISILIKELEAGLNHRLFDRHTRMVGLTTAGREFLPQARKIIEDLELAIGNIHDLATLKRGRVTIAAAIVLAATLVPPVIRRFVTRYPDISVQVRDLPEEEIRHALKRNEVDLAIGTVSDDDQEIQTSHLMSDRLMLVCRSDHRLARAPRVRWADLVDEPMIGLAKGNPLRDLVDRTWMTTGTNMKARYEVRFSTTAISMVAEGLGVAVLPENSVQLTTNVDVRSVQLIAPVISRSISILQLRQPVLSPAAAKMKEFLIETARRTARQGA